GSVFPIWKRMHDTAGVIQSTGPDMTRYFSTVEEAVQLVIGAIDNIDQVKGSVISRPMKSALIRDILDLWIRERGGRWEKMAGRPGDRAHEYLIGEPELPYTTTVQLHGNPYYIIRFNQPVSNPIPRQLCSDTAERLSERELLELINWPDKGGSQAQ